MVDANPMEAATAVPLTDAASPGIARRLAGRFALLAFGLYHVPLLLNAYPMFGGGGSRPDGLSVAWGHIFGQVGLWVARHVFGLTGEMPEALSGDNGDTASEYCRLLVGVVVAALAAAIWTFADRRRPRARWVEQALWILLRYAIALGLASYAFAKIYPQQFGRLALTSLETRVGELSPMALLWRFMEYSPVYSTIAGVLELAVVILLCFRRTATLGALLCLPVMANVMLMNLCYGVIVKLFSIMVFASAVVLVVYDARRMFDALVLRRAVPANPLAPPFRSRRLNQARWVAKLIVVGGVIVSSIVDMHGNDRIAAEQASPLYGIWDVESFIVGGRELAQTTEPTRWRRLASSNYAAIRLEDDTLLSCRANADETTHSLELTCARTKQQGLFHWTRDGDHLHLQGSFAGQGIDARFKRRDDGQLPLMRARFHWLWDA